MKKNKRRLNEFSGKVGTTSVYLCHVMAGRKTPGDDLVEAIIRESGGQLTYRDFKPKKAEQLKRIQKIEAQQENSFRQFIFLKVWKFGSSLQGIKIGKQ